MQNLAGCASGRLEFMGVLHSAGLCERASFHCPVQQRTGYAGHTLAKLFLVLVSGKLHLAYGPLSPLQLL